MSFREVIFQVRPASGGTFDRTVRLIWFVAAAVLAPFGLLVIGGGDVKALPWYVWITIPLLLLVIATAGFLVFKRKSRDAGDISISPERR